jgi:HK97 family phage major capsid protein
MGKRVTELREELKEKQARLERIFDQAGPELDMSKVTEIEGDSAGKAEKIRALNDELTDLGKDLDDALALEKAAQDTKARTEKMSQPVGPPPEQPVGGEEVKGLGELFVESMAYKGYKGGSVGPADEVDIDVKTLFETGAGWAPQTTRNRGVVYSIQEGPKVVDLIPKGSTNEVAVTYMKESTFTNNAAEVAEGGSYGEAALALTETTSSVRKIAVWLPVTDEQLEDVAGIQSYVNNRLRLMLDQRLDAQLLTGNGVAPNLTGILNLGSLQTQAVGDDSVPDAIYKAMTKVMVTGRADPNAVVAHPNDWQAIKLLKTADGIYIYGGPANPGPERIWGLGVVVTSRETENTILVGAFAQHSELALKRGVEFQITNAHSDYFIKGKQAIRADFRAAFVVYRDEAFCQVTGA